MYASAADLVNRFDERDLADLASDSGSPAIDVSTDARVSKALQTASGRINSSLMVAGLYTAAQLAEVAGDDLEYLKDLTCSLAMVFLLRRRGTKYREQYEGLAEQTEEQLELLRSGKNLFNLDVKKTAGQPTVDGPTAVVYERLNLLPDRTKDFFPNRGSRLPIGRA